MGDDFRGVLCGVGSDSMIHQFLTKADRREMVERALATCPAPDIDNDEAVVKHLLWLELPMTQIDRELAGMIDDARANRRDKFQTREHF